MGKTLPTDELLSTKLTPPQLRPPFVPREALLSRLDLGLDQKLTLISAPAGFGKTTLVCEWIAYRREKRDLPPIAWVSLDPEDNDPVRFWRYLLTACQVFDSQVSDNSLALLNIPGQPPFESVITAFINTAARLTGKLVLVIEDFHLISSPQVHETLSFFIDHLPGALHLILTTRSDPHLPLARLRARNELNELRLADLRFTAQESHAFFQRAVPFPLPPEEIARLIERTEGWAAGLRLVALALQGKKEPAEIQDYLTSFTGSHRPILEYLVEDVFNKQAGTIQEFLLQTSILPRLTASLCDAITGRQDSAQILEQIERANLFLTPLDASGHWYRFHALFAEAMQHYARRRLGDAQLRRLAGKASLWYEEHGHLPVAVEASLFTPDHARTVTLIERLIAPRMVQNEYHTLRRWLERVPQEVLYNHPEVCMTFAVAILFTSDRHAPETEARLRPPLQIAEQHWQREGNEPKLGEVVAFRSLVAWLQRDFEASFSLARQALALLPDQDRQWRAISLIMLGMDELMAGNLDTARKTLTETLALAEASENMYATLDAMLLLGEVCYQQGELHQAAEIFNQVLARTENAPMDRDQASIRRGRALLGLGMLALEWNDLEAADEAVSQAVAAGQRFPDEDLLADSPVILAQVKFARGEVRHAQQLLAALIAQANRPLFFRFPRLTQARFALASGDLSAVQRWAYTEALPGDEQPPVQLEQGFPGQKALSKQEAFREQQALVVARLHIAQGEAGAAIQQLDPLLIEAQENGRTRSELEIKILLALAHAALGDREQAGRLLLQALTLAQPSGYCRIFLDEGEALRLLLLDCRSLVEASGQDSLIADLDRLLAAFSADGRIDRVPGETVSQNSILDQQSSINDLIEPLSEQEQRVLRLLAAGLSNPEIAGELFISINTVKTHVKNIYAKLGVNSRAQARAAARRLKLL